MKKYKHAIKQALALYKSLKNNPIAHSVWGRNPPRRRRNMTVIAWDGKILATDKMRWCPYNGYKPFQRTKRPIKKLSSKTRGGG